MGSKRGGAKRTNCYHSRPPIVTIVSRAALDELVRLDKGEYVDDECHDVVYCHSHEDQALIYTTGLEDKALEERLFRRIQEIHKAEVSELMSLEGFTENMGAISDPELLK
ncbi:hypothetical protein IWQ57_001721, partial [Coemansia nantahalensis]